MVNLEIIVFLVFLAIFGLLIFFLGLLIRRSIFKKKKECSCEVLAKVVDAKRSRIDPNMIDSNSYAYSYSWFFKFRYNANGKIVEKWSDIGMAKKEFNLGEDVKLFYSPTNVEKFYLAEYSFKPVWIIFVVLGMVSAISGSVFLVLVLLFP